MHGTCSMLEKGFLGKFMFETIFCTKIAKHYAMTPSTIRQNVMNLWKTSAFFQNPVVLLQTKYEIRNARFWDVSERNACFKYTAIESVANTPLLICSDSSIYSFNNEPI